MVSSTRARHSTCFILTQPGKSKDMVSRLQHLPENTCFTNNRLFQGISPELLSEIGSEMEVLSFDPGDVIFQEGDPGRTMYLVGHGRVKISKLGRGHQQETLSFIEPGQFFGEMSLFDGQPRSAQATAVEPTILGSVDDHTFHNILEAAPSDLHLNFLRSVVERLRRANSHFITEVMRAERLSLVGTMANSIIHDLKNPISVIRCCADLLERKASDPSCIEFTQIINKALDGMMGMTQELLDFARGKSSTEMTLTPVDRLMDELDVQMMRLVPDRVHLVKDVRFHGSIMVDLPRFVRVVLNLVKNALDAMGGIGILQLSVFTKENELCIAVIDTGCGISAEMQSKIFEPFVTLGKSNGTGLGMAIAKSVVEAHNGKILLQSELGHGTTVEIRLPLPTAF
jgi:signal transduction histidine kinase